MSLYKSEYEVKIYFEDIDYMGIVWHGNYMRYMEQARCDLLSKLGYTYIDMKIDGYIYPIAKMETKYIKPARFYDVLTVQTELLSIEPSLEFKYTFYNKETNEKIFEARTMQIAINVNTNESVYTPPKKLSEKLKGSLL